MTTKKEQLGKDFFEALQTAYTDAGLGWGGGWDQTTTSIRNVYITAAVALLSLERGEPIPSSISEKKTAFRVEDYCAVFSHERLINDNALLRASAAEVKSSEERYAAENARLRRENDDLRRRLGR